MASVKKKAKQVDPIAERARTLNDQIASLESEIKKIDTQLSRTTAPRFRSTTMPHGLTVPRKPEPPSKPAAHEPVFEEVKTLQVSDETASPDQFNELGVRKYDLPALWGRLCNHFRRPTTNNPRLVNYLAAGGVHGLKPMRYEKRVARNRFMALVSLLFLLLLGLICVFVRNH